KSLTKLSGIICFSGRLLTTMPPWHENGNAGADDDCAATGEGRAHCRACVRLARLGAAGQRRRDGGAEPADCGGLAIVKFTVAGLESQSGGGAWRRKSSSAAFIAAMVCAA